MVLTIGATWLLYVSGIFVLWTPLPLLYRYVRGGGQAFLISAALTLIGLVLFYWVLLFQGEGGESSWQTFFALPGFGFKEFFGPAAALGFALLYFLYYVQIAGVLGWAHRNQLPLVRTFLWAVALPLVTGLLATLFLSAWLGVDLLVEMRAYLHHVLDKIIAAGAPAGLSGKELHFIESHREDIVSQVMRIAPAGIVIGTLTTVWGNVLVAKMWSPRRARGPLFQHLGSLTRWHLPERMIWIPLATTALYFFNDYIAHSVILGTCTVNVLWICGTLYFLQGLAIVSFYVQKRASLFLRGMVYGLLILFFQVLVLMVLTLGVFDVWFDFRKLTRPTPPPSSPPL